GLDGAHELRAPEAALGFVRGGGVQRVENGLERFILFGQAEVPELVLPVAAPVDDGVTAELAEPAIQGGLSAIGLKPLEGLAERELHHLARLLTVAVEARESEAVQPRKK